MVKRRGQWRRGVVSWERAMAALYLGGQADWEPSGNCGDTDGEGLTLRKEEEGSEEDG